MQLVEKWGIQLGQRERTLLSYLFKLLLIWLSWKGIIFFLGEQQIPIEDRVVPALSAVWEQMNLALVNFIIHTGRAILELLGYHAFAMQRTLWIDYVPGVTVGNYCLGIQLMYYFTMLVLVSPLTWRAKIIGSLLGVVITMLLNIIRVTGLVLVSYHAPDYMFLAHDHLFNIMVFGVLLLFFYYLTRRYEARPDSQQTT